MFMMFDNVVFVQLTYYEASFSLSFQLRYTTAISNWFNHNKNQLHLPTGNSSVQEKDLSQTFKKTSQSILFPIKQV